jgi:hypothetical protein
MIDPFNYFNISKIVTTKEKEEISRRVNYPLWHLIEFKNKPNENILIGDSRMSRLKTNLIKKITGECYYNFTYGGGTIEESISTFWETAKVTRLKNVVFGINFNNFNANNVRNRVPGTTNTIKNPILYLFNIDVLKASFLLAKKSILKKSVKIEKPSISKEKFWNLKLNEDSRRFYSNYKYPHKTYDKLVKVNSYCNKNNINVRFIILPTHVSLQCKIKEYNLEDENNRFLADIRKLGNIYNFDRSTELTKNKKNFYDPFHLIRSDQLCSILIRDIFVYKKPLHAMYLGKMIP